MRNAEYRVFEALGENCGVLVADPETNEIAFRFRRDWASYAGEEAEVLEAIAADLPDKASEMGVRAFLGWIENHAVYTFRCSTARKTMAIDLERTAQTLYTREVHSPAKPYQTHLPVMCFAAAGPMIDNPESGREEWVDVDGVAEQGPFPGARLRALHGARHPGRLAVPVPQILRGQQDGQDHAGA
jgi:hypothetical protein